MMIRVVDGTQYRDVSAEMLPTLQQKELIYHCGGCHYWHLSDDKTWRHLEAAIQTLLN